MHDNRPSSTVLNKARTNTLQLIDRNRHTNKEINCMVCDKDDNENIYHYNKECDKNILSHFLFDKENIEEKKGLLFSIWKRRQHHMKTIQIK